MAALHVNYRFVVDFCKRTSPGGRILDYGCGSGEIVRAGLAAGVDISGCETFYAGGHGVESAVQDLLGIRIFKMENGTIPFPAESFDCVVNNQVFEHVEDLDFVLSEIRRVLKRDGVLLSMFPSEDVVREGHCGIPLAHRFAKYPRFGYYWLLLGRLLGFGYHKKGMPTRQWARNFQHWLNHYCTYRSRHAIMVAFQRHGLPVQGIEEEYIRFRRLPLFTPWMLRKLAGMVLKSIKVQLTAASAPAPMVSFRIAGDDLSQRQSQS